MPRADQLLVQRGLAPSRSAAQRLIERGAVERAGPQGWMRLGKTGEALRANEALRITDDAETRWASRAGLKLDAALARTGLDARGLHCLDVGQSTGGFTDVLLARGAAQVVGIDVGHGQLLARLRADARVVALEGVNARALDGAALPRERFDLVVADLSFISLTLVLPALARRVLVQPALQPRVAGHLLVLVKPQFELQPAQIGKGGLVKNRETSYAQVEQRLRDACTAAGLVPRDWFRSAVAGGDGNTEFFLWATPA